jgi:hypothetical protein
MKLYKYIPSPADEFLNSQDEYSDSEFMYFAAALNFQEYELETRDLLQATFKAYRGDKLFWITETVRNIETCNPDFKPGYKAMILGELEVLRQYYAKEPKKYTTDYTSFISDVPALTLREIALYHFYAGEPIKRTEGSTHFLAIRFSKDQLYKEYLICIHKTNRVNDPKNATSIEKILPYLFDENAHAAAKSELTEIKAKF